MRGTAVVDVSVVVPVHDGAEWLPRALGGVLAQRGVTWEVVLVDDGSVDAPSVVAADVLGDAPLTVVRHEHNRGLGAACTSGLAAARGRYVAYLPADDVWFEGHLRSLVDVLDADPGAVAATAGVLVDPDEHEVPPEGLQPVQVLHRAGAARWRTREEFESDDLDLTVWSSLREAGRVVATGRVTCGWTRHPRQRRHLFDAAADGGVAPFRRRYGVEGPLRFAPRDGAAVDERELYGTGTPVAPVTDPDAPHVLLVGELAYNADRVLELVARGVRLSGLWLDDPLAFMTVGPLPFGGVADVPRVGWRDHVRRDRPDVLYCLLNWRTLPPALAVADALPDVPLVWHFKEAPQRCLARGEWPLLARLWRRADTVLLCSDEERAWLLDALPGRDPASVGVLDGDLPRARWFGDPSTPTSPSEDDVHTVCVGRPVGLDAATVATLARAGVHLHLHGLPPTSRGAWLDEMVAAAPGHVHLHDAVVPADWSPVLGRYDAGWLHARPHRNGGELRRCTWDDLNLPARLPTLAAAGLPVLLPAADGQLSAVNRVCAEVGAAIEYRDADDLVDRLRDTASLAHARAAMEAGRDRFTFDAHADRLVGLFLSHARADADLAGVGR